MPNFDGGHYFLTALIPVRLDAAEEPSSAEWVTSHLHRLREVLASMPTALQSPATEAIGVNSPFARCPRTHFARLFVVDDVAFNGRRRRDPIRVALFGPQPTEIDPFDKLDGAWLLFVTDFDAADGSDATLDRHLQEQFAVMPEEWRAILAHCEGTAGTLDATAFSRLIRDCQVETTMPFNDYYWEGPPPIPTMPLAPFVNAAIGGAAALGLGLLAGLASASFWLWLLLVAGAAFAAWRALGTTRLRGLLRNRALALGTVGGLVATALAGSLVPHPGFWLWLAVIGVAALGITLLIAYRRIVAWGQKAFPTARRSDLPGVMKALYLQQQAARFAVRAQGMDAAALHAAFGEFLAAHQPADTAAPTQPRGTVRS